MIKKTMGKVIKYLEEAVFLSMEIDLDDKQSLDQFMIKLSDIEAVLKKIKDKELKQIFDLFKKYFQKSLENKSIDEVLTYGLTILQEYVNSKSDKKDFNYSIDDIEKQFNCYMKEENNSIISNDLLDIQKKELPDFINKTLDVVSDVEVDFLALEKDSGDKDLVNRIFGIFHNIKGEAGFLGLSVLSQIASEAESILSAVRNNDFDIDDVLIGFFLYLIDKIREILKLLDDDINKGLNYEIALILEKAKELLRVKIEGKQQVDKIHPNKIDFTAKIPVLDLNENKELYSDFIAESNDHLTEIEEALLILEENPGLEEEINRIFRGFHTIKGIASFLFLDDITILTHEAENLIDHIRKGRLGFNVSIADIVLLSVDAIRKLLNLLMEQLLNNGILVSKYYDVSEVINDIIELASGKQKVKLYDAKPNIKSNDLKFNEQNLQKKQNISEIKQNIKMSIDKLDILIDNVGEMIITWSQIIQNPDIKKIENTKLVKDISQFNMIARNLQDVSISMRLVPVYSLFQKMQRLIRDLSKKVSKKVEVKLIGEETEIDKNIIDLISDPLVHMVRNSVDHGIESSNLRIENGKNETGKIILRAYQKAQFIYIQIEDDGKGLDRDAIKKKALEKGLINPNDILDDKKIFSLIFEPGFSTAQMVTDVSGRGVGMDVVKRNIEKLRGKIEVVSEKGKGSVFKIKLPLTLAVIDGILLKSLEERYILPINSIKEFVNVSIRDIFTVKNKGEMIKIRDKIFKLIRVDKLLNKTKFNSRKDKHNFVGCIVCAEYECVCILVDEVLEQQQVVIKSLGGKLKEAKGFAGGTILGDGKVGLILDIEGIVELANNN